MTKGDAVGRPTEDERIEVIKERWKDIEPVAQCEDWWYSAVRHCQRNMDGLCIHGDLLTGATTDQPDVHPDRYEGKPHAHAAEDIHFLLSLIGEARGG